MNGLDPVGQIIKQSDIPLIGYFIQIKVDVPYRRQMSRVLVQRPRAYLLAHSYQVVRAGCLEIRMMSKEG